MAATQELHDAGQSLWLDYITRDAVNDGTIGRYIDELSLTGLTSNPTIFDNALKDGDAYDEQTSELLAAGKSGEELFFELALRTCAAPATSSRRSTSGPTARTVLLARGLAAARARHGGDRRRGGPPTRGGRARQPVHQDSRYPEGLQAIEDTIAAGTPVNVTLLFDADQYLAQAEAYMRGIERRIEQGLDPNVTSVASLFVSRWDVAVAGKVPDELENRLGSAVAIDGYVAYRKLLESDRWLRLENDGARPQRYLFASTGTKDPALPKTKYVDDLAAPLSVNTMPEETLLALAEKDHIGPWCRPTAETTGRC